MIVVYTGINVANLVARGRRHGVMWSFCVRVSTMKACSLRSRPPNNGVAELELDLRGDLRTCGLGLEREQRSDS